MLEGAQRGMRVAETREIDRLEQNLEFLANVGSISPYVGLFGTVWGIMIAFQGLANVKEATIAMVAPGISEALIATAMGLIAAIPGGLGLQPLLEQARTRPARATTPSSRNSPRSCSARRTSMKA